MPSTYGSPHAGSIADLMRQQGQVRARQAQAVGQAEANRAATSGQVWGSAIQNIGQGVAGTLAELAHARQPSPDDLYKKAQTDKIRAELAQGDETTKRTRIGDLASMIAAGGYKPEMAEPLFRVIASESPEYAEPLMRSLMKPAMLKQVTDQLISLKPGYKAPEGFALSEGQTRFDASGNKIASVPKSEPVAQPYTLTPGSKRFGVNGEVIAEVPAAERAEPNVTEAQLAMMAANGNEKAAQALEKLRAQRPSASNQPRPLTQTAEAQIIQRLSNQWTAANKPIKELERQVSLMDVGMEAVKRGDLAQGAQTVLVTFQKILDPPSVVRDSEYMRSAAGQALIARVRGALERLVKGGAGVGSGELQKFADLAREAAIAQRKASGIDAVKSRLGKTADRYNIPQELVFEDIEPMAPPPGSKPNYLSTDPNFGVPVEVKKKP